MAVPDFQTLFRPLLEVLSDGQEHEIKDVREQLANVFSLTDDDIQERIPSGRVTKLQNRVGWAATYLYRTRLIDRPSRAVYKINDRGRHVLDENPDRIDLRTLGQFEELAEFRQRKPGAGIVDREPAPGDEAEDQTPEERIDEAYRELRVALAAELLDHVFDQPPDFFEQLVLDVLHGMGYGGGQENATERLGKSGDGGVDGIIREDRLGLDLIYIQAKRWQNVVGRPEIQKFFGALHGQRATKGVFITTSTFSKDAATYADDVTPRVILIDGKQLTELMIDYGIGVTDTQRYALKRIDLDYFATEDWNGEESPASLGAADETVAAVAALAVEQSSGELPQSG